MQLKGREPSNDRHCRQETWRCGTRVAASTSYGLTHGSGGLALGSTNRSSKWSTQSHGELTSRSSCGMVAELPLWWHAADCPAHVEDVVGLACLLLGHVGSKGDDEKIACGDLDKRASRLAALALSHSR